MLDFESSALSNARAWPKYTGKIRDSGKRSLTFELQLAKSNLDLTNQNLTIRESRILFLMYLVIWLSEGLTNKISRGAAYVKADNHQPTVWCGRSRARVYSYSKCLCHARAYYDKVFRTNFVFEFYRAKTPKDTLQRKSIFIWYPRTYRRTGAILSEILWHDRSYHLRQCGLCGAPNHQNW